MPEAEDWEIDDLALAGGRQTLVVEICSVVLEAARMRAPWPCWAD